MKGDDRISFFLSFFLVSCLFGEDDVQQSFFEILDEPGSAYRHRVFGFAVAVGG